MGRSEVTSGADGFLFFHTVSFREAWFTVCILMKEVWGSNNISRDTTRQHFFFFSFLQQTVHKPHCQKTKSSPCGLWQWRGHWGQSNQHSHQCSFHVSPSIVYDTFTLYFLVFQEFPHFWLKLKNLDQMSLLCKRCSTERHPEICSSAYGAY